MKYTIYKITNKLNGKVYIGKHITKNPSDSYMGSGKAIREAIKKHGKSNFTKEVLYIFDSEEEMNSKEQELVNEQFIATNKTYNMGVGGEGGPHFKGRSHSQETIQKIRDKRKLQAPLSEESRKKISESNKRRVVSEETKKKLSEKATLRFSKIENRLAHSKRMREVLKNNAG